MLRPTAITCLLIGFVSFARAGAPSADEKIQIIDSDLAAALSVPVSRLMMFIPKDRVALAQSSDGSGSGSARYFHFEDKKQGIIASGWFESQSRFSTAKKVWEGDTKEWSRQRLPSPMNVSFQKIGGWDTVTYEMPVPIGSNTHIRAHWVQAGTWIDLHLSITSERELSECRELLVALLKSIRVQEKK